MSESGAASPYGRAARKAERARQARLSRLPFLYDYALRGRRESFLAALLHIALVLAGTLVVLKAATGTWLHRFAPVAVVGVAVAVQAACRYLNAQAGRR